jgi:hypothetical protein
MASIAALGERWDLRGLTGVTLAVDGGEPLS